MKSFDLLNDPLQGVNLIEAGAGTGKTFTIAGLYLRLVVEQGLSPDRILVVTFTKAATEELKHRIRHRLIAAKAIFSASPSEDPWLNALAHKVTDHAEASRRISNTLAEFDRAAIFTIHGFCQRILQQFAIETGHRFQCDLVQDLSSMIQEIADDFWRRYISNAPDELAAYVIEHLKSPESLAKLLNVCCSLDIRLWPQCKKPKLTAVAPWRRLAKQVKDQWFLVRQDVLRLLSDEGLSARIYGKCAAPGEPNESAPRGSRIAGLAVAMDLWPASYPLFDQFALLSSTKLAAATKKNHQTPQHPFFDLCQGALAQYGVMERELIQYTRFLKLTLLHKAAHQLDQKKARHNLIAFDDLLHNVVKAITGRGNTALAKAAREQYAAALVDEFQDTDPLQYEIFNRLFGTTPSILFVIGDPKQAIYSFRGADVFAYIQAARKADHRYTLEHNWRATPGLIRAVNTVFSNRPRAFGMPGIDFTPARPGHDQGDQVTESAPSLHLWYLEPEPGISGDRVALPMAQNEATRRIVDGVASHIVDLLSQTDGLAAERIAVLTRSHRQAQMVKAALTKRNVPAVLYSAGSVFKSFEAQELLWVLRAVAAPGNPQYARTALATYMMGGSAEDFEEPPAGGAAPWEACWERLSDYHQRWLQGGFFRMFGALMRQEHIKDCLLGLPDGERRVTNLLHMAELLQQAEMELHLGPEGLLKWLFKHMHSDQGREEDQELRLESDARAVQVITIHKSKGLQYDFVFCPFTWAGVKEDDGAMVFHNPDDQHRWTMAVGPEIWPPYKRQGLKEALAENLRLLYVALTRARQQCYWAWGRIRNTECSAPAYLLHGPADLSNESDWPEMLSQHMKALTTESFHRDLQALIGKSQGSMALEAVPNHQRGLAIQAHPSAVGNARVFRRSLNNRWRIASFSSLTAGHHMSEPWLEEPLDTDRDVAMGEIGLPEDQVSEQSIFGFPKGSRAGLFFHDVLEHWDFQIDPQSDRQTLITEKLKAYGFESHWRAVVDEMLKMLATVYLPNPWSSFQLQAVSNKQRINEMAFYFPLKPVTVTKVRQAFALSVESPATGGLFDAALKRLEFTPVEGFLKGFVDLIFEYQGRYYIADWKSNHLGNRLDAYAPERLEQVMINEDYFLQYHLYVVALDQYLRQKMLGYDYERHFGGVYYIFLRGIHPDKDHYGIYYTRPEAEMIDRLQRILIHEDIN